MKRITLLATMLTVTFVLVACVAYGSTTTTSSWTNRSLTSDSQLTSWSITASSVNGRSERRLELTAEELANIHVVSSHDAGVVNVVLIQDGEDHVFSMAGGFDGTLDTAELQPGRLRMRLVFANAQNVDIRVAWGA